MATPVTVSTTREGDGEVVLKASGELDMSNVDGFGRALAEAVALADGKPVRVDLVGVEYLDSGAINALFAYADRVRLHANTVLLPVLEISGLTDVMSVEVGG